MLLVSDACPHPATAANKLCHQGLYRVRDALKSQLNELMKQKSKVTSDDHLIVEIGRLETAQKGALDDLVGVDSF